MSLRSEISELAMKHQELPDADLDRLSEKYGRDTQEIAFIFDVAKQGRLKNMRGVD